MKKNLITIFLTLSILSLSGCSGYVENIPGESLNDSQMSSSSEDNSSTSSSEESSSSTSSEEQSVSSSSAEESSSSSSEESSSSSSSEETSSSSSSEESPSPSDDLYSTDYPKIDNFVPNYSGSIPYYNGYIIGNHFIEYSNPVYENTGNYGDARRSYAFEFNKFKFTGEPSVLWRSDKKTSAVYNPEAAIAWARKNVHSVNYLCADFVSHCLKAGGFPNGSESSTGLCMKLLYSGLGFGEFIKINSDRTVTLPEYARPGDVVQSLCPYESLMIHSMLYIGDDENGKMKVICRNPVKDGKTTYYTDSKCYDCGTPLKEVFVYHFYRDDDDISKYPEAVKNDSTAVLGSRNTLKLDEHYIREDAIEFAKTHIRDGIGYYGARHLSNCLTAGNVSISFTSNNSMLFQLVTSGLGEAHFVDINSDRTVTLPKYAKAGDVLLFWCKQEGRVVGSFMIKGADENGKVLLYTKDMLNDENSAYKVDNECLGCSCKPTDVILYCFNDGV